jgi:ribosomal-protein-serine acetyltransferase
MFSFKLDDELKLALPEPHMAEAMTDAVLANLSRLKPWMAWAVDDYSIEHCHQYIQRTLTEFATDGSLSASIFYQGKYAGSVGFHNLDTVNRSAHVGYWIAEEFEGRGIITRCCRVIIDHLFGAMNLNRVQINCNVDNAKSRAVPERLGFKLEGIHRQVEFLHDRFGDWAVYAMLRDEWEAMDINNG